MARSFNGSSDVIDISAAPITAKPITMCAWVNHPTSGGFQTAMSIGINSGGTRQDLYIDIGNNNPSAVMFINGGFSQIASPTALQNGVWQHVAAIFSAVSNTSIWIDGVSQNSGAMSNSTPPGMNHAKIGGFTEADGSTLNFFNGKIAQAAMWNVELTTTELVSLAGGALPFTIRSTALMGYWPVDGIQSPEPDLSGFANNGALTGTSSTTGPPIMLFTPRMPAFVAAAAVAHLDRFFLVM